MKITVPLSWQSEDGRYSVRINRRCVHRMKRMAIAHRPNEVGTPLVGHYSRDGQIAYITSIGPLPPDSKGSRFSFTRGVVGLSDFFQRLSRQCRGQRYRVGEWHSHPGATPEPSPVDDKNQGALAADDRERLPEAILLILGGDAEHKPTLGVFVYSKSRGRVELRAAA